MGVMDQKVRAYYLALDRSFFMDELKEMAHLDSALPIGYGQTISQPSLVLAMTLMLDLDGECRVLEIGTGSGYQTALLAPFASEVYTVERILELQQRAIERLDEKGFTNIHYRLGDGSVGWAEMAPFDRIMVTAASGIVPPELIEQLAPGGRMVIPVGGPLTQELLVVTKDEEGNIQEDFKGYVRFVPLVGKYANR